MRERRPPRVLGGVHTTFWDYCNRGEFRLQRCTECQNYMWPPTPICDECLSADLHWTQVTGLGEVVSFCVFERLYYAECPVPWPVVLVRLDEGPLFLSNPYEIETDQLRVGMAVRSRLIDCEDDQGSFALPVFESPH